MKIKIQDVDAPKDNAAATIETIHKVTISECYVGIGIETDDGLYGIAQRDSGIEVMLNGKTVWNSGEHYEIMGMPIPANNHQTNSPPSQGITA